MIPFTKHEAEPFNTANAAAVTLPEMMKPATPLWLNIILLGMFAGCLAIPKVFGAGVSILMLLSLGVCIQQKFFRKNQQATHSYHQLLTNLSTEQKIICLCISAYGFVNLLSLFLNDQSYWTGNRVDYPLRFVLAVPLFLYLSRFIISVNILFWACCLGSITAGAQGLYEKYILEIEFASGQAGHHILFGNISTLLGMMVFCLLPFQKNLAMKALGTVAVGMAIFACFSSGSRGAILGLLCLLLVSSQLWRMTFAKTTLSRKAKISFGLGLILSLTALCQLEDCKLTKRMLDAYQETKHYVLDQAIIMGKGSDTDTNTAGISTPPTPTQNIITPNYMSSIGARLEMWRAAGLLFVERPILGYGPKTFIEQGQRLISEGKVRNFRLFDHPHNDILNTMASSGIFGLLALGLLLGVPMVFFIQAARSTVERERAFGYAGIILCIGFIVQGVSETLFDRQLAIVFYLMVVCLLLSQISLHHWRLLSDCFTGEREKSSIEHQQSLNDLNPSLLSHTASGARIKLIFGATLCVFGVFFVITWNYHPFDEPSSWLAEQSYWLAIEGTIRSYYFADILGYGEQLFITNKLFVWLGALVTILFGYSPTLLKLLGIIGFCGCIGLFYYFARTLSTRYHSLLSQQTLFLLLTGFLISSALVAQYSFLFSPETLVMSLGLLSFFMLDHGIEHKCSRTVIIAGGICGLSILAQTSGFIYTIAGLCLLIWHRQWRYSSVFFASSLLVASLYLLDVIAAHNWASFWKQIQGNIVLTSLGSDWLSYPLNALNEHKRYFRTEASFSWVLFIMIVFILGRKQISQTPLLKRLAIFSLSAAVALSFIAAGQTEKHLLLLWPLSICLSTALLPTVLRRKAARQVVIAFFGFYLICQGYAFSELWRQYKQPGIVLREIEKALPENLLQNTKQLVVPLQLITHLEPKHHYRSDKLLEMLHMQQSVFDPGFTVDNLLPSKENLVILLSNHQVKAYQTVFGLNPFPTTPSPSSIAQHYKVLVKP